MSTKKCNAFLSHSFKAPCSQRFYGQLWQLWTSFTIHNYRNIPQTLAVLQAALDTFHENIDIFVREGIQDHFNIPKIHQMIHYVAAIKSRGSADGYNSESPERLHIDFAKDAYRASNKREYVGQMTVWLGRQEAVAQFSAYLSWLSHRDLTIPDSDPDEEFVDVDLDVDETAPMGGNIDNEAALTHRIKPGFPRQDRTAITHEPVGASRSSCHSIPLSSVAHILLQEHQFSPI